MATIIIYPQKRIIFTFIVLTIVALVIALFGLIQQSYKTTILIVAKEHKVDLNFNETFQAQILQETVEDEQSFAPKTLVSMEDFASGSITIINNSSQNQTLVANTRLLSPDNLLFRLTKKVIVPAYQKVKTDIKADKSGQSYEIEKPTKFTVPGLSSILQTKIYAESKDPITGGYKKTGIVTQKDIDDATNQLKDSLQKQAVSNLEKKITDQKFQIAVQTEVLDSQCDAKANDEKEKFNVKMKVRVTAGLILKNELQDKINNKIATQISGEQKLASIDQSTFAYKIKSYNLEEQTVTLEMYIAGQITLSEKAGFLDKNNFLNKTKDEIKQYLETNQDIADVKINFSPFFLKKSPPSTKRINIIVQAQ